VRPAETPAGARDDRDALRQQAGHECLPRKIMDI
jgi:hypothetical protein